MFESCGSLQNTHFLTESFFARLETEIIIWRKTKRIKGGRGSQLEQVQEDRIILGNYYGLICAI